MKTTIISLAVLFAASAANADTVTRSKCDYSSSNGLVCRSSSVNETPPPPPKSYASMSKAEKAEYNASVNEESKRVSKWEAFCKPTRHVDALGITRLSYAEPGCEFGRSE